MAPRIVAGVDDTETAAKAATAAARLARAMEAELIVVSAFGPTEVRELKAEDRKVILTPKKNAEETAKDIARRLEEEFAGLTVVGRAAEGRAADALIAVAKEVDAEIIVVGNRRVQGPSRVLGSVAAGVARHAPCDVYIAHTHPHP